MNEFSAHPVCIDADPGLSDTLPGWVYTSPDILAQEREKIFFRTWHYAGATGHLRAAGDYITLRILDQSILVMRGRDGTLRGFYNVCQHRAHELLEGHGNAQVVICPYHAWTYHDDGSLRSARGSERTAGFDRERFCLKPVRVEVLADKLVFVNLDMNAAPLLSIAAGLEADLVAETPRFAELEPTTPRPPMDIAANWKVVLDNFHECYHCGPAHPAFSDQLDMANYRTTTHGPWSKQKGHLAKLNNQAYPVRPDQNHKAAFWYLWPTTTFGFMPGDPSLYVSSILPIEPGRAVRRFQNFALPGATPDQAKIDYSQKVLGPEDIGICEAVQRGLASRGYSAGRFIHDPEGGQTTEAAVHHFHRLYAEAMGF